MQSRSVKVMGDVKKTTASLIADAVISIKNPTRRSIAQYCGITEMTVCRAVSRLTESYLIDERPSKKSRSQELYIPDDLRFIIADLTLDVYSVYLLDARGRAHAQMNYTYNHSIDDTDNLIILSERAHSLFSDKANKPNGIGIIFADADDVFKFKATDIFSDCFGGIRAIALDLPLCLSALLRSSCDSHFPTDSMYYLCLGNRNLAYYVRREIVIKSNPALLVDNDGNTLREELESCISPEMVCDVIFKIVNSASALLDVELFLVESDRFVFGSGINNSIADKLKISFRDGRRLYLSDSLPHYYIKGGLLALQRDIITSALSN